MRDEFVYLLVKSTGEAVKVGKSVDPAMRQAQLPQSFDIPSSYQVRVLRGSARRVERLVQLWFESDSHAMPKGPGYTEWYRIQILPEVIALLEANGQRLGIGPVEPMQLPGRVRDDEARLRNRLAREARRTERDARNALRRAELEKEVALANAETAQGLKALINEWEEANAVLGVLERPLMYIDGNGLFLYLKGAPTRIDAWLFAANMLMVSRVNGCSRIFGSAFSNGDTVSVEVVTPMHPMVHPFFERHFVRQEDGRVTTLMEIAADLDARKEEFDREMDLQFG